MCHLINSGHKYATKCRCAAQITFALSQLEASKQTGLVLATHSLNLLHCTIMSVCLNIPVVIAVHS